MFCLLLFYTPLLSGPVVLFLISLSFSSSIFSYILPFMYFFFFPWTLVFSSTWLFACISSPLNQCSNVTLLMFIFPSSMGFTFATHLFISSISALTSFSSFLCNILATSKGELPCFLTVHFLKLFCYYSEAEICFCLHLQ